MQRVMVGVDGSPGSRAALDWARVVAEGAEAELVAAQVGPSGDDAELGLIAWCSEEATPVDRALVVDGDPADALLRAATGEQADLLVVGTRGSGGFAGLHLGSVAHHLAHHSTVPLAIVPEGSPPGPVDHLVLGVDGSDGSLAAARFCAELAPVLGIGVTAVFAEEPFLEWVPSSDPTSWHRSADAKVREWTEPLAAAGVTVDLLIDRDIHPVAALERALHEHPGSTAIVGTRGAGGFARLRLGRVPTQLIHHSAGPVIVVPTSG